ncbi:MAG: hypothetical protein J6U08_05395 [Paludibacteraceae bacterium]|nr:hypothetical protein [Paludibacteraceae bacterium]
MGGWEQALGPWGIWNGQSSGKRTMRTAHRWVNFTFVDGIVSGLAGNDYICIEVIPAMPVI